MFLDRSLTMFRRFRILLCLFAVGSQMSGSSSANGQSVDWETISLQAKEAFRENRYSDAKELWKVALATAEGFGTQDDRFLESLDNLAEVYRAERNYPEAEQLYQRSLAIREQALGPEHVDVADSLNGLAEIYYAQKKYAEAEQLYQRALAIQEKAL